MGEEKGRREDETRREREKEKMRTEYSQSKMRETVEGIQWFLIYRLVVGF